jgi:hypothetical protein
MRHTGRLVGVAFILASAILCASAASARTERFRWTEVSSTVDSFKLYWGLASGSYNSSLNVGIPPKDSTGAYYYDLVVPDADTIYVAVTATDNGLESVKSNQISRPGITSGGGGTTQPPTTTTGTAPLAPAVTASSWLVHVAPATSGTAATGGWITLYPYNSTGGALTFTDPVSGGGFPRDLDLTTYFGQRIDASRIDVEACAENSYGYTCAARLSVQRGATTTPSGLGAPGQPQVLP